MFLLGSRPTSHWGSKLVANIALTHYNDWWRKKLCGDKQQWLFTESSLFCYHGQWQHAEPAPALQYGVKSVSQFLWICLTYSKWFNKALFKKWLKYKTFFLVYSAQFFGLYVQWFFKKTSKNLVFCHYFKYFSALSRRTRIYIFYHKSTLKIILIVLRMSNPDNVDANYTLKY